MVKLLDDMDGDMTRGDTATRRDDTPTESWEWETCLTEGRQTTPLQDGPALAFIQCIDKILLISQEFSSMVREFS